ncbi:DNA gyrase C-terminal beta-propeller domain-containing protein, partial [uncultured Duncaniella sp.]|uniref:DNA gyrase C-terminal beta-propeller domain-containing protein n=1 Tax=uncultured Duncaniella sp. TaxID=2768039 RepID=UPI00260EF66C
VKDTIERRDQAIKDYKHYRKLLGDDQAIKDAVRDELKEGLKKYGKPRMAKLKNLKGATIGEPDEMKYILYNRDYYFCASSTDGIREIWPKIDNTYRMVQVKNSDNVLVFDQNGILKILNGYAFSLTDTGISMATLGASNVVSIMTDSPGKGYDSVVMITEQGYGKMMDLVEVTKSVKSRIINLNTDDKLADVIPVKGNCHPDSVIGMIQGDKMFYLKVEDFPKYKRSSAGNRMIKNVKDLKLSHAIYFDATDNPDYMLIYAESGYMKILDTQFLSFSKRGNNTISLQGKGIVGATLIHGTEDDVDLYMGSLDNGKQKVRIQIGKMVRFNMLATGEEQKFKMSTSIGTPVKVLRMKKNEWYAIT